MSTCRLRCNKLECGYPGRSVLSDIDLSVDAGQALVLLGRNGSGKSTLLKTLSREIHPLGGTVEFEGRPLTSFSHSELAGKLAVVPQEEALAFPFTAEEVVLMGRIASSTTLFDTAEDKILAESAMASADCLEVRSRPLNELSGGERQRVLIARALAQQAHTLVLDEPSTHLDISHQIELMKLIRALVIQGHTVIAALHDFNLAGLLADRIVILDAGRIVMQGSTAECLASETVDEVFGVRFDRVRASAAGPISLVPRT